MKKFTLFRILSYTLLPFAIFFGFMNFFFIASAFANPSIFFLAFLIAGFCIYTFSNLIFLTRHIDTGIHAKSSLKDWIKVNAYATLILGFMFLINALGIFFMPEATLRTTISKFLDEVPNLPPQMNVSIFIKILRGVSYFLFFFSILTLVQVFMSLKLLKQFAPLFTTESVEK